MHKYFKKFGIFMTVVGAVFVLSACKDDTEILPTQGDLGNLVAGQDGVDPSAGSPSGDPGVGGTPGSSDLQFDLEQPGQTAFDTIPLVRDDTQATTLYTIDGDYAYVLNPDTLEKVGDPLDPITHQPIAVAPQDEELPTENTNLPPIDDVIVSEPTVEDDPYTVTSDIPTEELSTPGDSLPMVDDPPAVTKPKLPNTGIFLEDD